MEFKPKTMEFWSKNLGFSLGKARPGLVDHEVDPVSVYCFKLYFTNWHLTSILISQWLDVHNTNGS